MKSVGDIKHADDADSADFSFNLNGNDNLNRRPTTHNLQPYYRMISRQCREKQQQRNQLYFNILQKVTFRHAEGGLSIGKR